MIDLIRTKYSDTVVDIAAGSRIGSPVAITGSTVISKPLGTDIDRVLEIWRDCLATYGGPYLFGARRTVADAMYAPVVTRFKTYHVALDEVCGAYAAHMLAEPEMKAWTKAAIEEPDDIEELDMEF